MTYSKSSSSSRDVLRKHIAPRVGTNEINKIPSSHARGNSFLFPVRVPPTVVIIIFVIVVPV